MSNRLPISLAAWDYDRMRALMDGRVQPEGIDLHFLNIEGPENFFRMLHFDEFDATEMSMCWYARTVSSDPRPFQAIPVFPSRMFRHSCIYINTEAGISEPRDLIGKKVGCPEYQMTAALWVRGILADLHGVPVESVSYFTGGLEQPGRTEVPLNLPPGIKVAPVASNKTLSHMLEVGEIDALYTAHEPSCYKRGAPSVRRLFENYATVERDYFSRTGIFPIMHTIVIGQTTLEQHPWVARSLFKACLSSKDLAYEELFEIGAVKYMLPWLVDHAQTTRDLFGTADWWPYGIDENRKTLETFCRYHHDQGLSPRRLTPEELFFPSMQREFKK